jgi:uncharacterized membrane protein YuzA (DUF378 family)
MAVIKRPHNCRNILGLTSLQEDEIMNHIALTKTDRAKKIGGFVWLAITKLAQGIAVVIKKINWNKVGFVSWRVVVLAIGVVIAFAKLIGSIIAGFAALALSRAKNDEDESQNVFDDDPYDPSNMSPYAQFVRGEDKE